MSTTSERDARSAPTHAVGVADPPVTRPVDVVRAVPTPRPTAPPAGAPAVDLGMPVVVLGPVPHGRGTARLALVVAALALLQCLRDASGVVVALGVGALALAAVVLVTARPRHHGRITAVTAVVVAVVALVGASVVRAAPQEVGEAVTAGLVASEPRAVPEPEAVPGLVDLPSTLAAEPFAPAVVETAAGPDGTGGWWYVAVVENATPGYVVPPATYEVVALREDGTVLDRDVTAELELWPGRAALTGTFDVGDDEVGRVEVRGPAPDDGPRTGTPGGLRAEGVTARTGATTTVRGVVRSSLGKETDVHVTVVARDAQERVTGAATAEVGPVPARGRALYEVRFDRELPQTTRYEVYARP